MTKNGDSMTVKSLFDKTSELKEKLKLFFRSKKKLSALENYSACAPMKHKHYIALIGECAKTGFLGDKETDFLAYLLDKYHLNYLDWAHKTMWLKSEMQRVKAQHAPKPRQVQGQFIDFDKIQTISANVPFEVLAAQQKARLGRRV